MASAEKNKRVAWDVYFLENAYQIATRATCDRKHVGCVIVRDRAILATGYNGSIRGTEHCDDAGHMMRDGHCVRTLHAEANAMVQAARNGVRLEGATLYCTAFPCWECFKLITNAGITGIVFHEAYRKSDSFDIIVSICRDLNISLKQVNVISKPLNVPFTLTPAPVKRVTRKRCVHLYHFQATSVVACGVSSCKRVSTSKLIEGVTCKTCMRTDSFKRLLALKGMKIKHEKPLGRLSTNQPT